MDDGEVAVALVELYLEGLVRFSKDGEVVELTEKGLDRAEELE